MKNNLLTKAKNRFPILFGIVTAILYLTVLNMAVKAALVLAGERLGRNVYLLQFLGTVAASLFLLLVAWCIGYGGIFCTKGRGLLYSIGTGGFMLTVAGIALASNLGTYFLTPEHTLRPMLPAPQILVFTLSMAGIGISEEFAFRGILTNLLREKYSVKTDKGIFLVVFLQGLLFGICHIVNALSGIRLEGVIVQAVMAALLGMLLGAIYLRTGSLWFVAFIHAFNDFGALSASGLYGIDSISDTIGNYSWSNLAGAPIYILVIAILLRGRGRQDIKGEAVEELPIALRVLRGVLLAGVSLFLIFLVFVASFAATWYQMEV